MAENQRQARSEFEKFFRDAEKIERENNKQKQQEIKETNRLARLGLNLADRSNKFAEQRVEEQKALNAALKKGLITQEQFEAADRASLKRQQRGPQLSGQALLQRGCLLYTSPSPRDQRGSRMPSSA